MHRTTTRQASFSHTHKENRLDRRCVHYTQIAAAQQEKMGQKVSKVVFDCLIYIPIVSLFTCVTFVYVLKFVYSIEDLLISHNLEIYSLVMFGHFKIYKSHNKKK